MSFVGGIRAPNHLIQESVRSAFLEKREDESQKPHFFHHFPAKITQILSTRALGARGRLLPFIAGSCAQNHLVRESVRFANLEKPRC